MPEASTVAADNASFSAGFAKVSGTAAAEPSAPIETQETPKAAPAPSAPAKDEWEGVPKKVRESLETISGAINTFGQRLKTTEGRVGAMQAAQAAAKTVTKEGGAAPSQAQIQEASTSGEKWKALLESFPDFKDGLEERFAQIDAALKQQQPFDKDGFKQELVGGVTTLVSNSARELREFTKLDRKHDGWEDTINTPQFAEWAFSNGPTPVDQAQWNLLKQTSPVQAEEYFQGFEQRYPQWWKDRGSLMASSSAKDAISLLDGYVTHNQASQVKQQRDQKNAQRLEAAVTPQGAGAPPGQPTQDENASFRAGFKKVLGRG